MRKFFINLIFLLLILLVFKFWFFPGLIAGGDFDFNFPKMFGNYLLFPNAWSWKLQNGLGGFASSLNWGNFNFASVLFIGQITSLSWQVLEKIGYFFPFLVLCLAPIAYLHKKLFNIKFFCFLAPLIFLFNTYILMLLGGGQIAGIGFAYAIAPLVLYLFIQAVNKENIQTSLLAGLILSVQLMFDIRIAYITLLAIGIFWLLKIIEVRKLKFIFKSLIFAFIIPGIISLFLHAFWLLPTLLSHQNPVAQLSAAYTSLGAVQYFSFAKFENTIALLHPNWPENIFGKVYFMRPEFLILPVLAFASLFFVSKLKNKQEKIYVLFFALLGIIGAFLAKGSNDPFGGIYLWMFNHIPGFVMFRDSTKFYLLVAISYSILIPFSVSQIYEFVKRKTENLKPKIMGNIFPKLFIFLVLGYMLFLIRPAIMGHLGGTFKTTTIPAEYTKLEQFLFSDNNFSRTLWVPVTQRFSFYSPNHPEINAQDLFSIYDNKLIQKLSLSEKLLQEASVRYVIVPYDSQGEIFLSDRKYDNKVYLQTVSQVKKIPWLIPILGFGKIAVFAVPNAKDHFYIETSNLELKTENIEYEYISPVEYSLNVTNAKKGDRVIFAESFDAKWTASNSKFKIQSSEFDNRFNSFILPRDGDYSLRVYYTPQDYVNIGVVISVGALIVSLLTLLILIIKKK